MNGLPPVDPPSGYVPSRNIRCDPAIVEAIRSKQEIDVDVVWAIDHDVVVGVGGPRPRTMTTSCFVVLERCEDKDRWARINGVLCVGYRAAYSHCDRETGAAWPASTIPQAIAERDVGDCFDEDLDTYVENVATRHEEPGIEARQNLLDAGMQRAQDRAADRWKTLARTPGLIDKEGRRIERERRRLADKVGVG